MISRKKLENNRLLADTLGIMCLIAVPFIGWLPGPGGIPLLLTGLGLLSIHNQWAKSSIAYVKKHSTRVAEIVFPPHKTIMLGWDIVSLCSITGGLYLYVTASGLFFKALATSLLFAGCTAYIYNRNRINRVLQRYKKH